MILLSFKARQVLIKKIIKTYFFPLYPELPTTKIQKRASLTSVANQSAHCIFAHRMLHQMLRSNPKTHVGTKNT